MQARSLMAKGETALACEFLRKHIIDGDKPNPKLLNLLGVCEVREGHREMAREIFGQVLEQSPNNPSALTNLGNLALLEGNHQGARELYTKALRQNPLLSEPRFNLILSYQDMGHFEKAMTAYQEYMMISKTSRWSFGIFLALGLLILLILFFKR